MVFHSLLHTPRSLARFGEDPFTSLQRALGADWGIGPSVNLPTKAAAVSMRVDVEEDEKAFHVSAELPGLTEKDVDVIFDDGLLTIRGEKKVERDEKKDTWHIMERSVGNFVRQLSLPTNIDANTIEASFDKGVLKVELPKQSIAQTTAKKINIKTN